MPLFSEACSHWDEDWQKLIQNVTIHFQYRRRAASLRHRNRYRTHFASHAPPKNRHGGLFTPHRKLAQGLSLTLRPTKTASLLSTSSPRAFPLKNGCPFFKGKALGTRLVSYENSHRWVYSGPFLGTFSKIRLHVHYRRSKGCDGSRFFRGAFIRGNNFVFNPEANSLLFRKFFALTKTISVYDASEIMEIK